jgi:hypothetical protein
MDLCPQEAPNSAAKINATTAKDNVIAGKPVIRREPGLIGTVV